MCKRHLVKPEMIPESWDTCRQQRSDYGYANIIVKNKKNN